MVSLAHTWGARYVLTDFYGWLRTVTDLSAAPAADTISVDKRTGGGTVERGVLTVYVCACVFAAAGVVWLRGGLTVCVCACVCAAAGVVCVYVLLQVIFYCLNYSI